MLNQNTFHQLGIALLILSFSPAIVASHDNCDLATDLLCRAYHLHSQGRAVSHQKLLFKKSLQLCPDRPEVHNTLASILEKQGKYSEAIYYYKQALKYGKIFDKVWYGLGETYYKQKRFPLSLEAHLHACQTNKGSKARVMALLKEKRYAFTNKGELIDQESLLVLYDKQRRKILNKMIADCGLSGVKEVRPIHTFLNLDFELGKTTLPRGSKKQLEEIAGALRQANLPPIIIHGHADSRKFQSVDSATSDKLNQKLSKDRAANIGAALAQQGVSKEHVKISGHGDEKNLLSPVISQWSINRRPVEIEVE